MTTRVINFDDDVASQATPSSTTFTFDSNEIVTAEDSKDLMVGGESGDAFQFELDTYKGFTNTRPVVEVSGGGHVIQDEAGADLAQRANLQFIGGTVTDDSANDRTIFTSQTGHIIENSAGTDFSQRANLQFIGSGITVSDDATNDRTVISTAAVSSNIERLKENFRVTNNADIALRRLTNPTNSSITKEIASIFGNVNYSVTRIREIDSDTLLLVVSDVSTISTETSGTLRSGVFEYVISTTTLTEIFRTEVVLDGTQTGFTQGNIQDAIKIGNDYYYNQIFLNFTTGGFPITVTYDQTNSGTFKFSSSSSSRIGTFTLDEVTSTSAPVAVPFIGNFVNLSGTLYFIGILGAVFGVNSLVTSTDTVTSLETITDAAAEITTDGTDLYYQGYSGTTLSTTDEIRKFTISTDTESILATIVNGITTPRLQYSANDNSLYFGTAGSTNIGLNKIALATNTVSKVINSINSDSSYVAKPIGVDGDTLYFSAGTGTGTGTTVSDFLSYNVITDVVETILTGDGTVNYGTLSIIMGSVLFTNASLSRINIGTVATYDNDIILPNVTLNNATSNYVYDTTTGVLTLNSIGTHLFKFSLELTNTTTPAGANTGYSIALVDSNSTIFTPNIVETIADGTSTFTRDITLTNSIAGTTYRIVEFVPSQANFSSSTTTVESGSFYEVFEATPTTLEIIDDTFVSGDFVTGVLTVRHDLNTQLIEATWYDNSGTLPVIRYLDTTIVDNNQIRITETAFTGTVLIKGYV